MSRIEQQGEKPRPLIGRDGPSTWQQCEALTTSPQLMGQRCRNRAAVGSTVCGRHGGVIQLDTSDPGSGLLAAMTRWNDGRYARKEVLPNTWRAARSHIRAIAAGLGADTDVGSVTEAQVETWLTSLHLAARSRNTFCGTYRQFFRWALRRGLTTIDPFAGLGNAKTPDLLPRRVKAADVERMVTGADFRSRVLLILAAGLGLRRAEIAALRVEHWDLERGTLVVHGKGDRQRIVPVEGEVKAALTAWLADGRTTGPMFPSYAGARTAGRGRRRRELVKPLSGNRIATLMSEAATDVGLHVTPHQLRHTFASEVLQGGASLEVVRRLLGHRDISTTGRYLNASAEELQGHVGARSYYRGTWGPAGSDPGACPGPDFT